MKLSRTAEAVVLAVFVALILAGCGEERHGPELVPVTGAVTHNGEPVEGATVVFFPQDHTWAAAAKSDSNGQFQLKTLQASPDDGAVPGTFKVTVRKNYMTPEDIEIWELPKPYGFVDTSGLSANVVVDKVNDVTFDLVD